MNKLWNYLLSKFKKPDNPYVYIFIRQNLSLPQQLVQTNHAVYAMAQANLGLPYLPSMILIGMPDKEALEQVIIKLTKEYIQFATFYEPDYDRGLTSIATVPIFNDKRKALSEYKLWKPNADNSIGEAYVNKPEV